MRNLETHQKVNEMTEIIFNACRGNATRDPKHAGKYTVVFKEINDNEHRVLVRVKKQTVAVAVVDSSDM